MLRTIPGYFFVTNFVWLRMRVPASGRGGCEGY